MAQVGACQDLCHRSHIGVLKGHPTFCESEPEPVKGVQKPWRCSHGLIERCPRLCGPIAEVLALGSLVGALWDEDPETVPNELVQADNLHPRSSSHREVWYCPVNIQQLNNHLQWHPASSWFKTCKNGLLIQTTLQHLLIWIYHS